MKFSIICPVYNSEKYLYDCINSIINQTFKDWELILIDDGSTDKSYSICEYFANSYQNIKVFKQKNSGPLVARYSGVKYCQGNYVLFIDSDDYWLNEDFLFELDGLIQENDFDILQYDEELDKCEINKDLILRKCVINKDYPSLCLKITKLDLLKNAFKYVEERYPDFLRYKIAEDFFLSFILFKFANNVYFFNKVFYYYRDNQSSSMHTLNKEKSIQGFKIIKEICSILNDYMIIYPHCNLYQKLINSYLLVYWSSCKDSKFCDYKKEIIKFRSEYLLRFSFWHLKGFFFKLIFFLVKLRLYFLIYCLYFVNNHMKGRKYD